VARSFFMGVGRGDTHAWAAFGRSMLRFVGVGAVEGNREKQKRRLEGVEAPPGAQTTMRKQT